MLIAQFQYIFQLERLVAKLQHQSKALDRFLRWPMGVTAQTKTPRHEQNISRHKQNSHGTNKNSHGGSTMTKRGYPVGVWSAAAANYCIKCGKGKLFYDF